jgi:hypothetical protein
LKPQLKRFFPIRKMRFLTTKKNNKKWKKMELKGEKK